MNEFLGNEYMHIRARTADVAFIDFIHLSEQSFKHVYIEALFKYLQRSDKFREMGSFLCKQRNVRITPQFMTLFKNPENKDVYLMTQADPKRR